MRFSSLPPTGNPINHRASDSQYMKLFPGYRLVWIDSGTSALAWTLLHIKKQSGIKTAKPKVLVPGYCCPDLLSAALFAGFDPVVVDINLDDPGYHLDLLQESVSTDVLAIIAINFLGIKERLSELAAFAKKMGIALIEDNAQWFPDNADESQLTADYVSFSFGRGKAVSLLGGGLVAVKAHIDTQGIELSSQNSDRLWASKVRLYHFLTNPGCYYWLEKAPFLGLGSTEYHPLTDISAMSERRKKALWPNIVAYSSRDRGIENSYQENLKNNQLGPVLDSSRRGRLLRYPYLCRDANVRNQVHDALRQKGLGCSKMYGYPLEQIGGVSDLALTFPELPNAKVFSGRLLTIPTHQGVTQTYLARIIETITRIDK